MTVQQLPALAHGNKGSIMANTSDTSVSKAQFIRKTGIGLQMSISLAGVAGAAYWLWSEREQATFGVKP
jgi:hypothetical protein